MREPEMIPTMSVLWLGWLLVTTAGWATGILGSKVNEIRSITEIPGIMFILAANGLLIGLITGFGQWLLLRRVAAERIDGWIWATLIGTGLAAPLGLAVGTAISWISFQARGDVFLPEGSTMFFSPFPTHVIFGGYALGAAQWLVLRHILNGHGKKEGLLWVVGTWGGIGLGVLAGSWVRGYVLDIGAVLTVRVIVERAIEGMILGIVTGTVLMILLHEAGWGRSRQPTA